MDLDSYLANLSLAEIASMLNAKQQQVLLTSITVAARFIAQLQAEEASSANSAAAAAAAAASSISSASSAASSNDQCLNDLQESIHSLTPRSHDQLNLSSNQNHPHSSSNNQNRAHGRIHNHNHNNNNNNQLQSHNLNPHPSRGSSRNTNNSIISSNNNLDQDDDDDDDDDDDLDLDHEHDLSGAHYNNLNNTYNSANDGEQQPHLNYLAQFAEELKNRRKAIRLSQKGAAQSLRAFTEGAQPCTDAIIYHFENLQLEPDRAMALIPLLKDWLNWAEKFRLNGKQLPMMSAVTKVPRERKRKVVLFNEKAKQHLEDAFAKNNHPDRYQLEVISQELGIPTRSIRKWFTNRRQRKRFAEKYVGIETDTQG